MSAALGVAEPVAANAHANDDVPAVVEVFSNSARKWFVALVVREAAGVLTVRFVDEGGIVREKAACREDPRVAAFGARLARTLPPGFHAVQSASRHGQQSYLDASTQQRYGSLELAWQAYLESSVLGEADSAGHSPAEQQGAFSSKAWREAGSTAASSLNGSRRTAPTSYGMCPELGGSAPSSMSAGYHSLDHPARVAPAYAGEVASLSGSRRSAPGCAYGSRPGDASSPCGGSLRDQAAWPDQELSIDLGALVAGTGPSTGSPGSAPPAGRGAFPPLLAGAAAAAAAAPRLLAPPPRPPRTGPVAPNAAKWEARVMGMAAPSAQPQCAVGPRGSGPGMAPSASMAATDAFESFKYGHLGAEDGQPLWGTFGTEGFAINEALYPTEEPLRSYHAAELERG